MTLKDRLTAVLISDVSLGYGTPQLLRLSNSLAKFLGAKVHILEPDEPERPPVDIQAHGALPHVLLERIYTAAHPYSVEGRVEFCMLTAKKVERLQPDILIFSTLYGIQILDRIKNTNRLNILYCIEDFDEYYRHLWPLVQKCQLIIFPEENRARIYTQRMGGPFDNQEYTVLYNANHLQPFCQRAEKNGRIFYGGTFHEERTYARYFIDPQVNSMPIDIYGIISGFGDVNELLRDHLSGANGGAKFCGYVPAGERFFGMLSKYLYSIVMWNPDNEAQLYAAPNKLFDAIACGVPPICAPHPQCVRIVRKWHCGIVLEDWSFEGFRLYLKNALAAADSAAYWDMVANCRRAMTAELSWDRQFEKLIPILTKLLSRCGIRDVAAA